MIRAASADFLMKRTHHFNELRPAHTGKRSPCPAGYHSRRRSGGLLFIDIRDREGRTQTVFDPSDLTKELFDQAAAFRSECVVTVTGRCVIVRRQNIQNPPGESRSACVARSPEHGGSAAVPGGRSRSRQQGERGLPPEIPHLDLRRPEMMPTCAFAAKSPRRRACFRRQGFSKSKTPTLFKSTPEGAAGISRAEPHEHRNVLRAATIAAAVQADPHVAGWKNFFIQARALAIATKICAPTAAGIHAGGHRDELHRARRHYASSKVLLSASGRPAERWTSRRRQVASRSRKALNRYDDKPDTRFHWNSAISRKNSRRARSSVQPARSNGGVVKALNAKGMAGATQGQLETMIPNTRRVARSGRPLSN